MKTYVSEGQVLTYTNSTGSDIAADAVIQIGDLVAIAMVAIANGESGSILVAGVVKVTKAAGSAWTQGETIYYDSGDDNFQDSASGNVRAGVAAVAAGSADTTGYVLLNAAAGTDIGSQSSHIADPAASASDITDNGGGSDPGDHTIPAFTNTNDLTDSGAGTADQTVEDVADIALDTTDTYTDSAVNSAVNTAIASISNNFKEMTTELALQRTFNAAVMDALALIAAEYNTLKDDTEANNSAIDSALAALEAFKVVASS